MEENTSKNLLRDILKPALVLAIVALVVSAALAVVYNLTKPPEGYIDDSVIEAAKTVLGSEVKKLDTDLERFSDYNVEAVLKSESSDDIAVYLWTKGYGGELKSVVGVGADGKVKGVLITSMQETAGLGDRTKNPEFLEQYIGKTGGIEVGKSGTASGNKIDAISGATISSKAVTLNVNNALKVFEAVKAEVSGK